MFLSASALRASAPGPADDFWFGPAAPTSSAGVAVSPETAMRLSVVFACVALIAQSVAKIPLRVMRGKAETVLDHPLTRCLMRQPNPWQTAFDFKEMMQAHLCLRSKAYAQIVYGPMGEIVALVPLHPDRVVMEQIGELEVRYRVKDWRGRERVLTGGEVWHLRQMALDGFEGLSTVAAQRDPIGSALAAQQYAGALWKNGAKHGGMWIEMPGKFSTPDARANYRREFRRAFTGDNAGDTPIMDQGMKLHELGMTNADAQFIESRKYSDADLCRMFLVPPHKVGILDRATNNNIEQQNEQFYSDTLMALFRRWEESAEANLLMVEEQATLRLEFDVRQLLRADTAARGKLYHDGIQDGWLTRNEVREFEGLEPLDGLDDPLEPLNMTRPGQRQGTTQAPAPADQRQRAILTGAADRAVIRECNAIGRLAERYPQDFFELAADFYVAHAAFLQRALAISAEQARAICVARADELTEANADGGVADRLALWRDLGGAEILGMIE